MIRRVLWRSSGASRTAVRPTHGAGGRSPTGRPRPDLVWDRSPRRPRQVRTRRPIRIAGRPVRRAA